MVKRLVIQLELKINKIKSCCSFLILVTTLLIASACEKDTSFEYTFYDNGNIKTRFDTLTGIWEEFYHEGQLKICATIENGTFNGLATVYYQNGVVKAVYEMQNGVRNGIGKTFFKNGNIQTIGEYFEDLKTGEFKEFYEGDSGRLHLTLDYFPVIDREIVMKRTVFNEKGQILRIDNLLEVEASKDTLNVNEGVEIKISLLKSEYENMRILVGGIDRLFSITDSSKLYYIKGNNRKAKFTYIPTKIGTDTLRGIVEDYGIEKKNSNSTTYMANRHYFRYVFYVIK